MTINKMLTAWGAIDRLMQESHSYKIAYGVMKVKQSLLPSMEFYQEKEREIIDTYADKGEDGTTIFSDKGDFRVSRDKIDEFMAKQNELMSLEVDFEPRKIDDCPQTISGADLEALEGIIEFKEPD